jgi:hypothetical protein
VKRGVPVLLMAMVTLGGRMDSQPRSASLPDSEIVFGYEQAAQKNVLAAVNPKVFFGYWSVCADGKGFGYGNTFPSLDGHQLSDALLWLGQVDVVKANWEYVRSFQREDGLLPLAIFPTMAGKMIGPDSVQAPVSPNGGLYRHWMPGNPLEATASITYIQNADVIFRHTLDLQWLKTQIPSINLAADYLDSLTTEAGAVRGAGYYVERPTRIESDGVTQCYAVDALYRTAALNRCVGNDAPARRYEDLAERIRHHFLTRFWVTDHFAEYLNPDHGLIASHGLTDVDWAAIATGIATAEQTAILWPQLVNEERFHYGGMPTGIATRPETYEMWEFKYADRYDLAAMGRVWYLEAWARWRMGDGQGLLDGLRKVVEVGRNNGYSWHERYQPTADGGVRAAGPDTYCEYPANLIRIVQEFLLGVDLRLDGSLVLAPAVTDRYWQRGFGQTLRWGGRTLRYTMRNDQIEGTYTGPTPLMLGVRLPRQPDTVQPRASIDGRSTSVRQQESLTFMTLPAPKANEPVQFKIVRGEGTR